uniref:Activin_recp domain-containing protein n=1 Tax=Heterorhabditis bacteriophora TaxID=37862 RepID=A0A1I7XNS9_HETBA
MNVRERGAPVVNFVHYPISLLLKRPLRVDSISGRESPKTKRSTITTSTTGFHLNGKVSPLVYLYIYIYIRSYSIICYDCHSDQGTCNEGECEGIVCIKMETANKDNGSLIVSTPEISLYAYINIFNTSAERKIIQKGCGDEQEEVSCQKSGFGSKWMSRCVCDSPLCNGDQALIDAGLESSSAPPPQAQFTQFALLVAILIFVGASCSLIVIATVCVQFC